MTVIHHGRAFQFHDVANTTDVEANHVSSGGSLIGSSWLIDTQSAGLFHVDVEQ
jgi:hypothetical protein